MAEGSNAEANCSKDDSSPGGSKKDRAGKEEEGDFAERLDGEKSLSSDKESKKGESSGLTPKGAKFRLRNYRPKRPPSSTTSSDDDERTVCDSKEDRPSNTSDKNCSDSVRRNATIITSAPSEEDTSADTSRDTETDHIELEPASPSAMETGSAASNATSNDTTGSYFLVPC